MENGKTTKSYKGLDGDDSLRRMSQVLSSIMSGGAGDPSNIQCLVQDSNSFNYRVKDIVFDNKQRCVKLHIDETEPIEKPDYKPEDNSDRTLYKQSGKWKPT